MALMKMKSKPRINRYIVQFVETNHQENIMEFSRAKDAKVFSKEVFVVI